MMNVLHISNKEKKDEPAIELFFKIKLQDLTCNFIFKRAPSQCHSSILLLSFEHIQHKTDLNRNSEGNDQPC